MELLNADLSESIGTRGVPWRLRRSSIATKSLCNLSASVVFSEAHPLIFWVSTDNARAVVYGQQTNLC